MSRNYQNLGAHEITHIETLINAQIATIHTQVPVEVVSVEGNFVTVKPLITVFYRNSMNEVLPAPPLTAIPGIPIGQYGTGRSSIMFHVEPGDKGVMIIMEADTDPIYRNIPATHRRFDWLDGYYMPQVVGNPDAGTEITADTLKINVAGELDINAATTKMISTGPTTIQASSMTTTLSGASTTISVDTKFETPGFHVIGPAGELVAAILGAFTVLNGLVTTGGETLKPEVQAALAPFIAIITAFTVGTTDE